MTFIDNFLNKTTMYRLVLYFLEFLLGVAFLLSFFGVLSFSPIALVFSTFVLVAVCWTANTILAWVLKVPTNTESVYITALILALIITPPQIIGHLPNLAFLIWAGIWAMASKYILNIKNKHIFNPAAFAVALTSLTIGQSASWWVGSSPMLIFVALGGLLILKKLRKFDVALSFLAAVALATTVLTFARGTFVSSLNLAILSSPLIFFAAIMITEPLTMPPTKFLRVIYGGLVGLLFVPQFHIGSIYFTPELALLAGNIYAYFVSSKERLVLKLAGKKEAGEGVGDFVFRPSRPLKFKPGQFMEWTLGHDRTDNRGNRRYFTLASSPTEKNLLLGVKFYNLPSSFKQKLANMNLGEEIVAGQLAGDFVLTKKSNIKLAFIAGGIGVTPFRSMVKYLTDTKQPRSMVLLYSNKTKDEIVYDDIFNQGQQVGLKTVYTLTDKTEIPVDWQGQRGRINEKMIQNEIPDFRERLFYISGSNTMVDSLKNLLKKMGVPRSKIKTDFFPGLA